MPAAFPFVPARDPAGECHFGHIHFHEDPFRVQGSLAGDGVLDPGFGVEGGCTAIEGDEVLYLI